MSLTVLASLTLYIFITSVTPGPNNLLLASSGLAYGLRRTLPQILGVMIGFLVVLASAGFGLGVVIAADPRVQTVLKVVALIYFARLTWQLWTTVPNFDGPAGQPIGFFAAALFQFVNPKGVLMAITTIGMFAVPGPDYAWSILIILIVDIFVGTPCSVAWAAFGATVRRRFGNGSAFVVFNRSMAVLTALTAFIMIIE